MQLLKLQAFLTAAALIAAVPNSQGPTDYALEAEYFAAIAAHDASDGKLPTASIGPFKSCHWYGTAPFCNGKCDPGETQLTSSNCGDGKACATGGKKYCCK